MKEREQPKSGKDQNQDKDKAYVEAKLHELKKRLELAKLRQQWKPR